MRIVLLNLCLTAALALLGCAQTPKVAEELTDGHNHPNTASQADGEPAVRLVSATADELQLAAAAGLPPHGEDAAMDLQTALRLALRNSQIVRVSEGSEVTASGETFYDIAVSEAQVQAALAAFDSSFAANFYSTQIKQPPNAFFGPGLTQPRLRDEIAVNFSLTKPWITGGQTAISFNPDPGYLYIPNSGGGSFNPRHVGEMEFSIRQPLLRNAGVAFNRAPIQIEQIRLEDSAWEFKKAAMASVRSVADAYWDLHATRVALTAVDEILPLIEEVVRLQEEAYKTQWVIYADVAKAYAQLHDYRQQQLELQSEVRQKELTLRNLIGLPPFDGKNIVPVTSPASQRRRVDVGAAVHAAMANQPDIVRRRLDVRIRELEWLISKNDLKPTFDIQALYRMNGVGQDVGSALKQMATGEFSDWLVGATFSVPLGRRQATATARAASLELTRAHGLLQQMAHGLQHRVADDLRRVDYTYREYQEAERKLAASKDWLKGARLRYQHPNPEAGDGNLLLQVLNDYLSALRFRTSAATEASALLAEYNLSLIQLEETKGTLLSFFDIDFAHDPCRQSRYLEALSPKPLTPLAAGPVGVTPQPGPHAPLFVPQASPPPRFLTASVRPEEGDWPVRRLPSTFPVGQPAAAPPSEDQTQATVSRDNVSEPLFRPMHSGER